MWGGINVGGVSGATISNTTISGNAATMTNSVGDASASSGGGEISGTLTNVRLTGNTVSVGSAAGNAFAAGGATVFDGGTISDSLVSDNRIHVSSPHGTMTVRGGGLDMQNEPLTLTNSLITHNVPDQCFGC